MSRFSFAFSAVVLFFATFSVAATFAQESEPFAYNFPNDVQVGTNLVTDFSYLNENPAGTDGFIRIVNGKFANDKGRIRFWGVNFCFGANFPTHDESERIARRLSSLGVNCVRFHHHETSLSPNGLFLENGTMDPDQVDKFDYLLAELHKNGIYANLNLHVGRSVAKSLGLPPLGEGHSAGGDKHAMHFMPQVQKEFWKYCRDFVGHKNPYRGMTRGTDPGVAMIEVLNENRFSRDGAKYLRDAKPVYKNEILKRWNQWLANKFKNDTELRSAWMSKGVAQTAPMANSESITAAAVGDIGGGWRILTNGGKSPVDVEFDAGVLRIVPQVVAAQGWHQQLACEGLTFKQGDKYTLTFDVRADSEKRINFNTATSQGEWRQLGLGGSTVADSDWKTVTEVFEATANATGHARLAFDIGGTDAPLEFRNILLQSGAGWVELPPDQGIQKRNVAIPGTDWVPAAYESFIEFMMDTERQTYHNTIKILRDELGVKVPICGTQTNYVGAKLASQIGDYTDIHSYWNHPLFQGRDWNQENWTVGNEPLAAGPYSNKWPRNNPLMRAAWRVHGMPFTYSEWNIGEPSLTSAGGIPIMSLMGSLQDWDGVFFFDFEDQGGRWDTNQLGGFFRMNGQPCKLALMGACGKMYRKGDLEPLTEIMSSAEGDHYEDGKHAFSKLVGLDANLERVTGTSPPIPHELAAKNPPRFETPDGAATWDATDPGKAIIKINTPKTKSVWGLIGNQTVSLGDWKLQFGTVPNNYGAFVATSRDGLPLSKTKSALLSLVNHVENTNMTWNENRTSVGTGWGGGPTRTWGVQTKVQLPVIKSKNLVVFAVDAGGNRMQQVPITNENGNLFFELGPKFKTLMYEFSLQ